MPEVARIGDPFTCGDVIAVGSGSVFANGIPVTRLGDSTGGHPCGPATVVAAGSDSVFADGIAVGRKGDPLAPHGTCSAPPHGGTISIASPNVFADS